MKPFKRILGLAILLSALIFYNISCPITTAADSKINNKSVEVIVQKAADVSSMSLIEAVGGELIADLPLINGFAAKIPSKYISKFSNQEGVLKYSVSNPVDSANFSYNWISSDLNQRIKIGKGNQFRKPQQFNNTYKKVAEADGLGEKGKGVTIAVLDSGTGKDAYSKNNLNIDRSIAINPLATTPDDLYGHGTHVAGILNGSGPNEISGIAPQASIINVKLGNDQGEVSEIDLMLGLQWVYQFKDVYGIDIVNLSVSSTISQSYIDSPISAAVEQLWLNGVVVVVAAGNDKENPSVVDYAPANDPFVITVGAVDASSTYNAGEAVLASWSRNGETSNGIRKPEITAPGVDIISLIPGLDSILAVEHPDSVINKSYMEMSGTSMSAPVVSGVIALMLEANPNLTPNQVKAILTNTTSTYNSMSDDAGVVNARKAVALAKAPWLLSRIVPENYNEWPLSNYLDGSNNTVDYTKASWGAVDWLKASWGNMDWTKASWGSLDWAKASWGTIDWAKASWGSEW